jgi:hypothetical protein
MEEEMTIISNEAQFQDWLSFRLALERARLGPQSVQKESNLSADLVIEMVNPAKEGQRTIDR